MRYQRLRQISIFLFVVLGLVGCAKKVESEKVTVGTIDPNLICSSQRVEPVAQVHLRGSGFAPMPTNILKKPTMLVLPSVELEKVQDLTGSGAPGTNIVFSGDPGEDFSENLQWDSSERLVVNITESDPVVDLDPGLYDVTVTNPDGEDEVTVSRGLAVVDPPVIASVEPAPPAVCTAQQPRTLVLQGQNFLGVGSALPTVTLAATGQDVPPITADSLDGCTEIPGTYAGDKAALCTTLTVTLPADVPSGTYDVVVTSPAPASCHSSEPIKAVIVPPPAATTVTTANMLMPPSACLDQAAQTVTVDGGPFAQVAGAQPSITMTDASGNVKTYASATMDVCAPPMDAPADLGVQLCTTLTFTIPQSDLAAGDYTLSITNPDPVGCSSVGIPFTINPPPQLASVDPTTVCTGGSQLVATGIGFLPGDTAELRCAETVLSTGTTATDDGTQLTIQFGPGIGPGEVCDLVVKSADGCEDRPLPHQRVTGTQGPILFNVDPYVVPSGRTTRVLLLVTTLQPPFTVKMWSGSDISTAVELEASAVPGAAGESPKILATIPSTTLPGDYALAVEDDSQCAASMQGAITVTDNVTISTGTVTPSFGEVDERTAITIKLGASAPSGTPRAFLSSTDLSTVPLESVTTVDATTLTAVVPANTAAGTYDVVIVWPDGSVAVLSAAYTSVTTTPRVEDVVPQSIVAAANQSITITGTGFSSSTVGLSCVTSTGLRNLSATAAAPTCDASGCVQTATVDASTLAAGDVCVVRVTNGDGAYDEFSAVGVTVSSGNISAPVAGTTLNIGRRALTAAAVKATSASRFVYAIGGDDGNVANAFDSVEYAPVDVFGGMGAWQMAAEPLGTPRTFPASTTIGRYIYVLGGNDGGGALASGERALVLSPEEVPKVDDVDLCLAGSGTPCFNLGSLSAGLEPGTYSYRVAALIDATDAQNLGGETLASTPTILRLQSVGGLNAAVRIAWTAPEDSLGTALTGIIGYRVYRTPKDGVSGSDEQLLAEVGGTTLEYIDDGSTALDSATTPLPPGSTSAWQALPPVMGLAREAPGAAAAPDPSAPDTTWYVYALLGRDGATQHSGYEYLTVTVAANGRQTVGAAWTPGNTAVTAGRSEIGAWVADRVVSSNITDQTHWIYVGSGLTNTTTSASTGDVDAASVTAGGQLSAFTAESSINDKRFGYGAAAAAGKLFAFGGYFAGVKNDATGAFLSSPPPALNAWTNEGITLTSYRYRMGSTIQSAFIFLIGGDTGSGVTNSTEMVVW